MRLQQLTTAAVIACASIAVSAQAQPAPPTDVDGPFTRKLPGAPREKGAFLGVAAAPASPEVREQLKLAKGMGLAVQFVEPGSPADRAGVKEYDVLTKVGDQQLVNAEQLAVLVRSHKPDQEIELTLIRGGEAKTMKVKLAEKELAPVDDVFFYLRGMPGPQPSVEPLDPGAIRRRFDEVRERMARPGERAPGAERPGYAGPLEPGVSVSSTTVWTDGEQTLTITSTRSGAPAAEGDANAKPERKLVAKDKDGKVLFEGPIDTPEAREKIPAIVAEKLRKMESANRPGRGGERPAPDRGGPPAPESPANPPATPRGEGASSGNAERL